MKNYMISRGFLLVARSIVLLCAFFFIQASHVLAADTRLDIKFNTGTAVAGETTNLASGNNSDPAAANFQYVTLFSETQPAEANTTMRDTYATAGTWYQFANVYYNPNYASAAQIKENITGRLNVRTSSANDRFEVQLWSVTSAGANIAQLGDTLTVNGSTSATNRNLAFNNAAYTLPAGALLKLKIRFRPNNNNNYARIQCNSANQSYITVGIQFDITSTDDPARSGTWNVTGTASGSSPGTAQTDYKSTPSYQVTAPAGYNIQRFQVDAVDQVAAVGQHSFTYNFTSVNRNKTVSVLYQLASGTFNLAPGSGGGFNGGWPHVPAVPYDFPGGSTYTYSGFCGTYPFVVIPDTGYGISQVLVDGVDQGVPLGQTTPYDITVNMCVNNTLAATFLPYYTVTSSAGAGGAIDPNGDSPVLSGQAITYTITPDNGYRILSVTDNGVNVGNNTSYTLTNVTSDHTVVASFLRVHAIQASAGPNGTISPIGEVLVDNGTDRNFVMTPNLGYRVNDVLVDGVSIGAVSSYTFTNVTAPHTLEVTFIESPTPSTYCAVPPYINTPAPPNVMLMLSVETPMMGPANPSVTCTGTPSSTNFTCSTSSTSCSSNGALGCYDNSRNYYGYFESNKCYSYAGSGSTGLFSPAASATNKQCDGTKWSGNFLNWMTMTAVDAFRKAFTGGNRVVDTTTDTVLLGARLDSNGWFPDTVYITNAELYTPYSGTRYFKREAVGIGFGVCNSGQTTCTITTSGSGESQWPVASTNTQAVFSLRIKVCDSTGGVETRCNSATNKPEGTIQKYMEKMRFALMSYAADNSQARDGGVLRSPMKWVNSTIPNGMKYHDAAGNQVTCTTTAGCVNPEREVETTGIFVNNPAGASGANSGVINYINKFAYSAGYKSHDPMGELYYQVVRYFRNLTPSNNNYCNGLTTSPAGSFTSGDGFAYYCNATKTNQWGWRDPTLYSCSQNYVVAVNDANPWLDKRIPGSAFTGTYGGSGTTSTDYCGSSLGACDTDFNVDVLAWTNAVGNKQGLTPGNLKVGCVWAAGRNCDTAYNAGSSPYTGMNSSQTKYVTELGKVIGTHPYAAKYNSYNVAGLAYYAHMVDLRPDLGGTTKRNLTTYMIDTQEPAGDMLVGPLNMLYLAAKFGGFEDKDNDQSVTIGSTKYNAPYNGTTCGGVSSTPNVLCSEWDADNDGYPDNYFFASEASRVEAALNKAFSSILNRATSGTAAAVANNRSGERGANVIQAMFYPQWPLDKNIQWLGDVQALWFYLDPLVQYSGIYEDSDQNLELNLDVDRTPGTDSLAIKALWKAGPSLHLRSASDRKIYTLLDSTVPLTSNGNTFSTANRATLKPLMNLSAATDTVTDAFINYARGVDSGAYRSRTLSYNSTTAVWKLGDVINSTPQIQGSDPLNTYAADYSDSTYTLFTNSNQYRSNNYVYVGANDGMLHAFRLGLVQEIRDPSNKFRISQITDDTDLGKEEWAFIPRNVLPYIANCAQPGYCHQYLVDGTPVVFDASINSHSSCAAAGYWECTRQTTLDSSNNVNLAQSSWRTVLLGSMGHGGATRDGYCNETLNHDADPSNNSDCIKTPVAGNGYSSYFALDITSPLNPGFMWEFSDAVLPAADRGLGLTTSGPAIVRINTGSASNGRFFAVFASGPTGPIDQGTRQIKGRSDQNLKIYVVDVNPFTASTTSFVKCTSAASTSCNYWVIDTGIKYAFAHSLYRSTIDLDRASSKLAGNYSDDVVYITYNKATTETGTVSVGNDYDFGPDYPTAWDKGGILRLVTKNDPNPSNWFVSTLIDDIGPITSSVDILQNRSAKKLWIFFGEGRYFFTGDDLSAQRRIFGVADPCYRSDAINPNTFYDTAGTCPAVTVAELQDQTNTPNAALETGKKGWYITLTAPSGDVGAERLFGKINANTNGVVLFPTFLPSTDLCAAGGTSSLWATQYSSGGVPPASGLKAKLIATTSDSPVPKPISLTGAFTRSGGRQLDAGIILPGAPGGGGGGTGDSAPPVRFPQPVKRVLNVQER